MPTNLFVVYAVLAHDSFGAYESTVRVCSIEARNCGLVKSIRWKVRLWRILSGQPGPITYEQSLVVRSESGHNQAGLERSLCCERRNICYHDQSISDRHDAIPWSTEKSPRWVRRSTRHLIQEWSTASADIWWVGRAHSLQPLIQYSILMLFLSARYI